MRVDLEHATAFVAIAQDAQVRLGTHHPEVHAAAGMLALLEGDLDQARREARANVELVRASQDQYGLAGSLVLYGYALLPDTVGAAAAFEEAASTARDADPFQSLHAVSTLAHFIVHEDPSRAQELLQEAGELARKLGDPLTLARVVSLEAGISLVRGDWQTALRTATEGAQQDLQSGGSLPVGVTLLMASTALAHLRVFEPAAILTGFVDACIPVAGVPEWETLFAAADEVVLDTLGTARTQELKAYGATLTLADAVALLRGEHDRAFADELAASHSVRSSAVRR
jgi:hypothetical protein